MPDRAASQTDAQWRTAGDRIQTLLEATSSGGAAARERAERLVGEIVELYGAGLARMVDLIGDPAVIERLAADDLMASLLLVHGLHPHDLHRRVSDALEKVRPYLGSHGGDVHLLEIVEDTAGGSADYTVRLEFAGSCQGCPSSAVTLELTVEDAIRAAAPEVSSVVVSAPAGASPPPTAVVIPAESLLTKVHGTGGGRTGWHEVPDFAELSPGEVGGFVVDHRPVLACRVGDQLYAYRDRCPVCAGTLAGAVLQRSNGAASVLRCPRCRSHFDAVHAGAGLDDPVVHLDPLPLLVRDGVLSLALPAEALGAPA
ncbi:MAG TPA: NifU family protein [Mycobacterium sp.]|nr:NifU family protein [Mycobacterium sp.]